AGLHPRRVNAATTPARAASRPCVGQVVRELLELAIAEAAQRGGHDRVAPRARMVAKLLHRLAQIGLVLSGEARHLLLARIGRQVAGAAAQAPRQLATG